MSTTNPTPSATVSSEMLPALQRIGLSILVMRGQRVILDSDLAELYGVETKRFNEAVKRNIKKFPLDLMFELSAEEFANLRSQFATSSLIAKKHGGRRYAPRVFTEHGALMAAMVLNSPRAVQVSLYVVRTFVRLREAALQHKDLAQRLAELEMKNESLDMRHSTFKRNTRVQLKKVFETLRELMAQAPEPAPPKPPIGFVHPKLDTKQDKSSKESKATKAKSVAAKPRKK